MMQMRRLCVEVFCIKPLLTRTHSSLLSFFFFEPYARYVPSKKEMFMYTLHPLVSSCLLCPIFLFVLFASFGTKLG